MTNDLSSQYTGCSRSNPDGCYGPHTCGNENLGPKTWEIGIGSRSTVSMHNSFSDSVGPAICDTMRTLAVLGVLGASISGGIVYGIYTIAVGANKNTPKSVVPMTEQNDGLDGKVASAQMLFLNSKNSNP